MNPQELVALVASVVVLVGLVAIWWPGSKSHLRIWYHDSSNSAPSWMWAKACEHSTHASRARRNLQ